MIFKLPFNLKDIDSKAIIVKNAVDTVQLSLFERDINSVLKFFFSGVNKALKSKQELVSRKKVDIINIGNSDDSVLTFNYDILFKNFNGDERRGKLKNQSNNRKFNIVRDDSPKQIKKWNYIYFTLHDIVNRYFYLLGRKDEVSLSEVIVNISFLGYNRSLMCVHLSTINMDYPYIIINSKSIVDD